MEMMSGYKQTEVGVIPEDWKCEALDRSIAIIHGYGFQGQYFKSQGVYRLTTPGNFSESGGFRDVGEKQKFYGGPFPESYLLKPGDLIVVMTEQADGLLGSAALIPQHGNYLHNQRLGKVKVLSTEISIGFLYRIFNSKAYRSKVRETAAGTKVKHTSPSKLLEITVALPPTKAEQEAIAEALSDADALIESLEQLIAKKRHLKQGAMQELLTGKKRLDGFSKEWSKVSMRDILTQNATYGIVTAGAFVANGVKMVRGGDINGGRVSTDLPMVSHEKNAEYSRTNLIRNDGVIALVGYPGEAARIPDELIGANISRAVGLLRLNSKVIPDYIVCFLNSPNGRRMVLAPSAGSAQQVVNLAALNKLEFSIPEIEEQKAIAAILSDMAAEIAALEERLGKTRALKQGMMHVLLTGRIRLSRQPG